MTAITCRGVSKTYPNGFTALAGIDLGIAAGSLTVILGPSGAGKSTLLRCLNGLERPTSGTVVIGGEVLTSANLRRLRCRMGMVFQHFHLIGRLSVMTNVLCGRLAHRTWLAASLHLFRREDVAIAAEALARVDLAAKAWERADRLSGGQQQRVGLARALAQQPSILLADEPVASLDAVTGEAIMDLLARIRDQDGLTLVVSLHQVELARRYADRIVGINAGQIVFDGPPGTLSDEALATIYRRTPVAEPIGAGT